MLIRKLVAALGIALALAATAGAAAAQDFSASDRAALAGPWHGFWKAGSYLYEASMRLQLGPGGKIEGAISWTLRASPRPAEQSKIGLKGTEHVRGKFNTDAGVLAFEGYRKNDPNNILGLDKYRMVVAENRRAMGGITWDHGRWTGEFFLKRENSAREDSGGGIDNH